MFHNDLNKMVAMSEEALKRPGWELLADYLSLHGRGIRKPALAAVDGFTASAVDWSFDDRLELVLWILHGLGSRDIVVPLRRNMIDPACREWLAREPGSARAHLWSAKLHLGEAEVHYRRALELDPQCDEARGGLCNILTGGVGFNQHHLPSYYINNPVADLLDLAEAEAIWAGYDTSKVALYWLNEIAEYRSNAEAWLRDHPPSSTV